MVSSSNQDGDDNMAVDHQHEQSQDAVVEETKAHVPPPAPAGKTPGVYVRGKGQPNELDMLWSTTKNFSRDERSPIVYFSLGVLSGIVLSGAIVAILMLNPGLLAEEGPLAGPLRQVSGAVGNLLTPPAGPPKAEPVAGSQTNTPGDAASTAGGETYKVKSGDTLEKIARKFYGSGDPQWVERIQKANNMSSPHQIKIDQELTIPPRG
jgi:LysM repeat protein